jgi:simple sugar transport system permease protein
VLLTGSNPLSTYKAIFDGTGWPGSRRGRRTASSRDQPAADPDPTTPLILAGFAVAFAFRAGLFNIGGQGQYTVGAIVGGDDRLLARRAPGWLHIIAALVLGALAAGCGRGSPGSCGPPSGPTR